MKYSFFGRLTAFVLMAVIIFTLIPANVFGQMYYGSNNNAMPSWKDISYQTVSQGNTLSTTVLATDDNGDYLTYASVSLPEGASFDGFNRLFVFTPRAGQLGTYAVTLSVTDNRSQPVLKTFYVGVVDGYQNYPVTSGSYFDGYYNRAPYFSGTSSYYQIRSGGTLAFRLSAIDADGSQIFYSSSNLPAGASFNGNSGEFRWTPLRNQRGTYNLQFLASDSVLSSAALNVTIVVDGGIAVVNQIQNSSMYGQPYFTTSPSLTGTAGQTYVYNAQAYDPNGYQITYALTLAPSGAYINSVTGALAWTAPSNAVTEPYRFTVTATDNQGLSATQSFDLKINGGVAKTSTVVRYVSAPFDYAQGKPAQTVATVNYSTPTYQPAYQQSTGTGSFNIAFRPNANNETIVSWDTVKAARGEVVFGFNSQPTARLLNYDFTTGQSEGFATHHEISLGKLEMNRTYYMRVVSRTGSETDISGEVVIIPVNINSVPVTYGTASAADTLGNFLASGWLLLLLTVIIIVLAIYLMTMKPRTVVLS